ncbi:MAG: GIY-YIG nuclease family protein [Bacteroidetes bacterium]|nr:GIY-YIG nuclease family protein [Bacteroidota bacterium]
MYFVYILRSLKDGRFYKGMTSDIERRIYEHNSGQTKSTKAYLPWELVYSESHETREEARKRELYFKSGIGREVINKRFCSSTG